MEQFSKFFWGEWYFAWPMVAMSATAVGLIIWRVLLNVNANTNLNVFLPQFQEKLKKEGVEGALRYCKTAKGLIPQRLFAAGLETSKQGLAAMRRGMANVIELDILPQLNYLLPSILAIAKIATMVGLLGTVISMIGTFSEMEGAKQQDVKSQGGKIGLALFATALGLVTAIPLVFAHVQFKAWVAAFEVRMKSAAQKLMLLVQGHKPPAGAAVPAAPNAKPQAADQVR